MYMQDGKVVVPYGRKNPGVAKLDFIELERKLADFELRLKALEEQSSVQEADQEPAKRGRKPKGENQ
jgi:hypothetical protein